MVYGFKDYWKEGKDKTRQTGYMIVIVVFLALVLAFVIYAFLFHPQTGFEVVPMSRDGVDYVNVNMANTGRIMEEDIGLALDVSPASECIISKRLGVCGALENNRVYCEYIEPWKEMSLECPLTENGTVFLVTMKSKYETVKLEFTCSPQKCHETVSYLYGSFPVIWNYLFIYPGDRLMDFLGSFTG